MILFHSMKELQANSLKLTPPTFEEHLFRKGDIFEINLKAYEGHIGEWRQTARALLFITEEGVFVTPLISSAREYLSNHGYSISLDIYVPFRDRTLFPMDKKQREIWNMLLEKVKMWEPSDILFGSLV